MFPCCEGNLDNSIAYSSSSTENWLLNSEQNVTQLPSLTQLCISST